MIGQLGTRAASRAATERTAADVTVFLRGMAAGHVWVTRSKHSLVSSDSVQVLQTAVSNRFHCSHLHEALFTIIYGSR